MTEPCSGCRGSGMEDTLNGARECTDCRGACNVRARDGRGRFTRPGIPPVTVDPAEHFRLGSKRNGPDTNCCGKPVGCSNIGETCLYPNHRWKRLCISAHPLAYPPDAPEREGLPAPVSTWDVLRAKGLG